MELETLRDLYINELKDLYSAEAQLVKALPRMAKAATHPKLKRAFETHLRQTERQVERLERVFQELDVSPRGKKCVGMQGLIEEAQELIREKPEPEVLDAGLISKAQHVEHYEIAGYGTVRAYAQQLGEERQAGLLQQTLDEEGQTDKLLSELAESAINIEAEQSAGSDEEDAFENQSRRGPTSKRAIGGRADRELIRGAAADAVARSGASGRERGSGSRGGEDAEADAR